jgi:hypothetical protein
MYKHVHKKGQIGANPWVKLDRVNEVNHGDIW